MGGNFWKDKRVFITGANGFIGSCIAKHLVDQGSTVFALVRYERPQGGLIVQGIRNRITVIHGDLLDYRVLEVALGESAIDMVFHLAAQSQVGTANTTAHKSTLESNIIGTLNVLEAIKCINSKRPISAAIFAASDKAYGDHGGKAYKEEDALYAGEKPGGAYEASKACSHILSRCYAKMFDLPVCVALLCNTYGGGDMNWQRRVPKAMRAVLLGSKNRIEYPLPATEREMLYITDAVSAYLTLAQKLAAHKNMRGEAFNFGSKRVVGEKELVNMIVRIACKDDKKQRKNVVGAEDPTRPKKHEIPTQRLNSDKAAKMLEWKSSFSLEKGLEETYLWYRDYFQKGVGKT